MHHLHACPSLAVAFSRNRQLHTHFLWTTWCQRHLEHRMERFSWSQRLNHFLLITISERKWQHRFCTVSTVQSDSRKNPKSVLSVLSISQGLIGIVCFLCVCTSLFGKDWRTAHPATAHTHTLREKEREGQKARERALLHSSSGICLSPGVLRERTCCPCGWMKETEGGGEKSEWMDRINEWRASSRTRLTGFVSAGIEHASLAGSGRECYLRTDLFPSGLSGDGEAASCWSFRPEPVPAPACTVHSDMGPVCCKPDRLKKQHLQGNRKQMLEIFN